MYALRHGNLRVATLLAVTFLGLAIAGCSGDDGDDGAAGPPGADGGAGLACWDLNENGVKDPEEDLNGDGVVDVKDCNGLIGGNQTPAIGDGSELTQEQVDAIGRLVATIDSVEIASPPVVNFTVTDSNGNPAVGIAEGSVQFTIAKLVPGDPAVNGGLSYWQSYVNRVQNSSSSGPGVLPSAIQATSDREGTLQETAPGKYVYTFATDVANVTEPLAVEYEPSLTHRVGLEIRLDNNETEGVAVEVPLAPLNPVYDFVPDGGAGSGTKNIADTNNCADCHYQFELHGGPRKTVEYCVTCHNQGTIDPDSGESVDMAYLAHSIHGGGFAEERGGDAAAYPYIIYGFSGEPHDYSKTTYPQTNTYCETCHEESEATPDGNAWNEGASAKACGGCHADGLVAADPDPVTGIPTYAFDHTNADANIGIANDGSCGACHLGAISTAGPALAIHSSIRGDDRVRTESGDNFVFEILDATSTGPGETPVITFKVSDPEGNPYDIVNDPQFDPEDASLNLYVAWNTNDVFNGTDSGNTWGARDNGSGFQVVEEPGYPYRMYLRALQRDAVQNTDGSYTVTFFSALPTDFTGDVMIGLAGHPLWEYTDADGVTAFDDSYAVAATFYPGTPRDVTFDNDGCNGCHERLAAHGGNRAGNYEICLVCHTADTAITDGTLEATGYGFGRMIHMIHTASNTYAFDTDPDVNTGIFAGVTYPQGIENCFTCHKDGKYSTARATARAVSIGPGGDDNTWLNDEARTPTAQACGTCHVELFEQIFGPGTGNAVIGHFESNGAVWDSNGGTILKGDIVGTANEACAVCHGAGSTFDTALYHGVEE